MCVVLVDEWVRGGMISGGVGIRREAGRRIGGRMTVAGARTTGRETTIRRFGGAAVSRWTTVSSSSVIGGARGGGVTVGCDMRVTLGSCASATLGSGASATLGSGACGTGGDVGAGAGVEVGCVSSGRPGGGRGVGRLAGSMVGAGAGMMPGNGRNPGGGCRVGGATASPNMVASWSSAWRASAAIGASGDAGDGWRRMFVKSCAAAMARSPVDGIGMTTFVGNHASVSAILSARVDRIHTR